MNSPLAKESSANLHIPQSLHFGCDSFHWVHLFKVKCSIFNTLVLIKYDQVSGIYYLNIRLVKSHSNSTN